MQDTLRFFLLLEEDNSLGGTLNPSIMTTLPIHLPEGFTPVISERDVIVSHQLLAQKQTHEDICINVAKELALPPAKVKKMIRKNPGDVVHKGDRLAVYRSLLGVKQRELICNIEGTVLRYERFSGNLLIRKASQSQTEKIISPVAGKISLCNNKRIVIETTQQVILGKNGVGAQTVGSITILEIAHLYRLDSLAIGKILVAQHFPRDLLLKAVGIGVSGIIGVHIDQHDIEYLIEKGMQTVPIIQIDQYGFSQIREWEGKKVTMNAETKMIILL
jgi:hypothetical protein